MNPNASASLMYVKQQGLRGDIYEQSCCVQMLFPSVLKTLFFGLCFAQNKSGLLLILPCLGILLCQLSAHNKNTFLFSYVNP